MLLVRISDGIRGFGPRDQGSNPCEPVLFLSEREKAEHTHCPCEGLLLFFLLSFKRTQHLSRVNAAYSLRVGL